jgi:hypothetical protein
LESGRLVPFATVGALAEGQRYTRAGALELLGERSIMARDDGNERLEGSDQLQGDFVDL